MKPLSFALLLAIVLTACAPAPTPTVTPIPPTVPPAPTLAAFENMLVYDMPEMYQVQIKTLQFQTLHQPPELLTMDVYYPPTWQPGTRVPAVLMANSFPLSAEFGTCGRNCFSFPSWGRLIAANGLIAVTYDTKYANDLEALADHVRAHAADLGIDGDRLGVMGVSSDATLAESFVYQPNRDYVKFGVFYYGYLLTPDNFLRAEYNDADKSSGGFAADFPDVKQLRTDLPVLVVRCGEDYYLNQDPADRFAQLAEKVGAPLTLIRFDEGTHVFDTLEASTGQVRVRAIEIVKQTLEFMKAAAAGQALATPVPSTPTLPPSTPTPDNAALASGLDAQLQKMAADGTFSGAVLVARNGQVMFSQGYGFSDHAKKTPNTPQTKFRIGELTQPLTAMAILILQEQGKLNVQDNICKYLSDCPDAWKSVTLHHLLTHTSGIYDSFSSNRPLDQMLATAKAMPLNFRPGEKYGYIVVGYNVLGKVIEAVSGQSYEAFLQKNIFEPLQMTSTGYDHGQPDLALGYSHSFSKGAAKPWDPEAGFAAGALYSTVEDLLRWDQALYTQKLVSQKALDAMFTPYVQMADQPGWGMGYGYSTFSQGPDQPRLVGKRSVVDGFAAATNRYPEDQSIVIVLANQADVKPADVADVAARQLLPAVAAATSIPTGPIGRGNPAMAYDAQADRVILFGGTRIWPAPPLSDTWAYDPVAKQWSLMHPAQSPQGIGVMAYDSRAGRMILYVFATIATTTTTPYQIAPLGETWAYDVKADAWTNLRAANTPLGLVYARLAYDSESDRVILFGGADYPKGDQVSAPLSDETWVYDYGANAWTKMNPKARPPTRWGHAMTYDTAADRVIIFGGATGGATQETPVSDTWAYDYNADTWTEQKPAATLAPRVWASLVYDSETQHHILVGGDTYRGNPSYLAETWAYDFRSDTWANLSPSTGPGLIAYQGMAYIPTTKQVLASLGGEFYFQPAAAYCLYDVATNQWAVMPLKP